MSCSVIQAVGGEGFGKGGGEGEFFASGGMGEAELAGMQEQAGCGGFLAGGLGVDSIPKDRASQRLHVNPDLVGATGVQVAFDQGPGILSFSAFPEDFVSCDGRLSLGWLDDCHFLSAHRVPSDAVLNFSRWRGGNALDHAMVDFCCFAIGKLAADLQMGGVVFCGDKAAAGVFVQAMDDPLTLAASDSRQFPPAVVEQCVEQSPIGISGGRMHDDSGCFVDHNQVLVFIDNLQGDGLRLGCRQWNRLWNVGNDGIASGQFEFRFGRAAIHKNRIIIDKLLDTRA